MVGILIGEDAPTALEIAPLAIETRLVDSRVAVMRLQGSIDTSTGPTLRAALLDLIEQGHYQVVMDLRNLGYIDSHGLGVIIGGVKRLREHRGSLSLVSDNVHLERILGVTHLNEFMTLYPNEEDAVRNAATRAVSSRS